MGIFFSKKKKTAFALHFKKGTSKTGPTFCLDKRLICYIVVAMLISAGVFFITSPRKLVDQNFLFQSPLNLN